MGRSSGCRSGDPDALKRCGGGRPEDAPSPDTACHAHAHGVLGFSGRKQQDPLTSAESSPSHLCSLPLLRL